MNSSGKFFFFFFTSVIYFDCRILQSLTGTATPPLPTHPHTHTCMHIHTYDLFLVFLCSPEILSWLAIGNTFPPDFADHAKHLSHIVMAQDLEKISWKQQLFDHWHNSIGFAYFYPGPIYLFRHITLTLLFSTNVILHYPFTSNVAAVRSTKVLLKIILNTSHISQGETSYTHTRTDQAYRIVNYELTEFSPVE